MSILRVGIIFKRKSILFDNKYIKVYKPIGYGLCKYDDLDVKLKFYSGKYYGKEFLDVASNNYDDICAAPVENFENYLGDGIYNIDEEMKMDYSEIYDNTYYLIDLNKCRMDEITEKLLIEKCKKAFGDNIQSKSTINLKNDDELDELNQIATEIFGADDDENMFLQYEIEDKYRILKEHVFGQDEQLKEVLACIIKNLNLADSGLDKDIVSKLKSNILLLGKTGVGKTLIVKEISKLLNVPYVIEDATRYTASGWSGEDVENMLRNLYLASDKNITNAEMGILVVDEFDKLCNRSEKSTHSTISVQQSLLKLVEGTKINISKTNHTDIGGFQFDTSKLTIIFAGAFDGIDKIIEKRTNERKPGFNTTPIEEKDKSIQIEDLIEYGVIGECAGRMSNIIELNNPSREDLKNAILHSKSSTLNLFKQYLKTNSIKVKFDEAFIDAVVDKTITLQTGYRGLNQTLNNVIEKELYDIMSGKQKVLSLTSEKVK